MKLSEAIVVTVAVALVLSCSVKEDRGDCPCRLVLDMGEVDTSVVKYAELVLTASDGFCMRDTLAKEEFEDGYIADVPRGPVAVGVYCGALGCVDDEGNLEIDYGNECPFVYMHSSQVLAEGESVAENVSMRKNHCVVNLKIQSDGSFPFRMEAKGNVDGYGSDGEPSEGDFMYAMYADDGGVCQFTLPRQTDASLVLEVYDDTDVIRSFALGEYVEASGYDWEEDDLKDITVSLDYALTRIVISVADWTEEYIFDVVI
jgi:hypothetical protein